METDESVTVVAETTVAPPASLWRNGDFLKLWGGGVGIGLTNSLVVTLRQIRTPRHMLGRMNAGMRLMLYGSIPLGALHAGALGVTLGDRNGLLIAAVGLFLGMPIVWFSPVRRLKDVAAGVVE